MFNSRVIFRFWLFLLVVTLVGCATKEEKIQRKTDQANNIMINALGDRNEFQKALIVITEVLEQDATNLRALKVRAAISMKLRNYKEALQDYRSINTQDLTSANKLMECMLVERIQSALPLSCYRDTLRLFSGRQVAEYDKLNFVVTRLLAEDRMAQQSAINLINNASSLPEKDKYEAILVNFERKRFIRTMLP